MDEYRVGFRYKAQDNIAEIAVLVLRDNWVPVRPILEAMGISWNGKHATRAKTFGAQSRTWSRPGQPPLCVHLDQLQNWLDAYKPGAPQSSDPQRVFHFIGHLTPTLSNALLYDPTASSVVEPVEPVIEIHQPMSVYDRALAVCTHHLRMTPSDAEIMLSMGKIWFLPQPTKLRDGTEYPRSVQSCPALSLDGIEGIVRQCKQGRRPDNLEYIETTHLHRRVNRSHDIHIRYLDDDGKILSEMHTRQFSWEKEAHHENQQLLTPPNQPLRPVPVTAGGSPAVAASA